MEKAISEIVSVLSDASKNVDAVVAKNPSAAGHMLVMKTRNVLTQLIGGLQASQGVFHASGKPIGEPKPLTRFMGTDVTNKLSVKENPALVQPTADEIAEARQKSSDNLALLKSSLLDPEVSNEEIIPTFDETEWRMMLKMLKHPDFETVKIDDALLDSLRALAVKRDAATKAADAAAKTPETETKPSTETPAK